MILLTSDLSLSNLFLLKPSLRVFVILSFPFLLKMNLLKQKSKKGLLRRFQGFSNMMASIIDKACIKQRSVVITLIDLKKAFGEVHHNLIKEVFNRLNNKLATRKNLTLWNLSQTSDCSFCFQPESLLHVVAGCKSYLSEDLFKWRHDSALNLLASTLCLNHCTFYVDLPQHLSPSLVTGDDLRPDMLISTPSNTLYVLELSAGFEKNLDNKATRKFTKHRYLLNELTSKYRHVKFVNLSIGSLGIFGQSCNSFIQMCSDLTIDKAHTSYIIAKLTTIIIPTTYHIFCMRNEPWTNPDLLSYYLRLRN